MNHPVPDTAAFAALLRSAERVLVVGDGKPDGDSLGSSTALYQWLKDQGKTTRLFCATPTPSHFRFLDAIHELTTDVAVFDEPWDIIVTLDASDIVHCGISELVPRAKNASSGRPTLVVIDHHATNKRFGDLHLLDTTACSTCEVVYRFLTSQNARIHSGIATSLLTGICTDTSHFSNAATNATGVQIAGELCSRGARLSDLLNHLLQNKTVPSLRLWGLGLARLQERAAYDMVITGFLTEDLKDVPKAEEAIEGVANFLNAVCSGADTICVLRDLGDGKVKGSLRSINRDISKLAQALGGGGHKKAAGFTVPGRLVETGGRIRLVSTQ